MTSASETVLEVANLTRRFGGLVAVNNLSFAVKRGTIHGLIGPNGAGKTTTFNVISGFYKPSSGHVFYQGTDVSGHRTSQLASLGLVRTFQGTTLFQELTVFDNVRVGCHLSARASLVDRVLGLDRQVEQAADTKALNLLDEFHLADLCGELTSNLSHGHQRALGIVVALAADPVILLLDEPFTGMNPEETRQMVQLVRRVRDRGVTIMLIEHDMSAVMELCDTITVMNFGLLLTEGRPEQIRTDPRVIEAYLGSAIHAA
jgi:branched-chain amino acid transport system ATP-binding protein